jgi:serine/threonine-protein kinase
VETSDTPPAVPTEPSEASDLVGSTFADRYSVVRLISEGANTLIYDAVDAQSGRPVTLKLVRADLTSSPSFRRRFDETIRSVAALSHPNIAAVFDWGMAPVGSVSTAYVVIEHLSGGSLRDMFDRGRELSPSQALAVGLDACRGLDYAHRRGFVHTELTPSKLVFGDDRRLRIIDFGLARLLGETAWKQPDSVSTHVAWYAAPEQGLGLPVDGTTDVYALCLSLHEAVTGTLPFRHDSTVASLSARVGRLMPVSADLGPLASVFERAGRPEADERATAAQFGKALVQAAAKLPRPDPLPLLSTGLFDMPAEQLRNPADPTGGVNRPPGEVVPVVVVPVDEPDAASGRDDGADGDDGADEDGGPVVLAAGAATAAGVAAAGSSLAPPDDPGPDVRPSPDPIPIVEGEPDAELPGEYGAGEVGEAGDLVILPIDSDIDRVGDSSTSTATTGTDGDAGTVGVVLVVRPEPVVTQPIPVTQVEAMPRRRRRFPWKILLGLLVVAALVTLGLLAARLFATPTYIVPELTGMPRA